MPAHPQGRDPQPRGSDALTAISTFLRHRQAAAHAPCEGARAGTAGLVYTDTWSVSPAVSFPRGSCNPRLHRVAPQQRRLHDPAGNADHHGPASPAHAE